jgi:hypothetical protein
MGLLTKCPQCGCTIAKGTTCPNCFTGEAATSMPRESLVAEFERRRQVHRRHYTIYMGLAMGLGLTTLLLAVTLFMLTKAWRLAGAATHAAAPPVNPERFTMPAYDSGDTNGFDDTDISNLPDVAPPVSDPNIATGPPHTDFMESDDDEEDALVFPKLNADDFSYSGMLFWLVLLASLMALEGFLGFLLFRAPRWWPIELDCPNCNERIDEVGGNFERCPSCMVRLQ